MMETARHPGRSLNIADGQRQRRDAVQPASCDWLVRRNEPELISVVQNTAAACADRPADQRACTGAGDADETRPAALRAAAGRHRQQVHRAAATPTSAATLMKQYQKIFTENVIRHRPDRSIPGALIINKRFANIPPGAPIFMFNWAEDTSSASASSSPPDKQARATSCSRRPCPASRAATARSSNATKLRRPRPPQRSAGRPDPRAGAGRLAPTARSQRRCSDSCSCGSLRRSRCSSC